MKVQNVFPNQYFFFDSVYEKDNQYYSQVFLEDCTYVVKQKKIHNQIIDYVEISSDSDEVDLLEKKFDYEENSDEEIMEKIQLEN